MDVFAAAPLRGSFNEDKTMRRLGIWCTCLLLLAGSASAAQATKPATQTASAPVNVNTASEAELEALPGVGPATAKKIISGRPYSSAADLAKAGVPQATVNKLTSLVTFSGGRAAAASASAVAKPAPSTTAPTSTSAPAHSSSSAGAAIVAQQPPAKGMVWVNLDTKVFHREGDRYYGKTKNGKFMTEADASKAGYHEARTGAAAPSGK